METDFRNYVPTNHKAYQEEQHQQQPSQQQHHNQPSQQQPFHPVSLPSYPVSHSSPSNYPLHPPFRFPPDTHSSSLAALGIDHNTFSTDVTFQIPSFLSGPMATPGGGADVIAGSNAAGFGGDFVNWYHDVGPSKQVFNAQPPPQKPVHSNPPSAAPVSFRLPTETPFAFSQPPQSNIYPLSADPSQLGRSQSQSTTQTPTNSYHSPSSALPADVNVADTLLANPFQSLRLPFDPASQFGLYSTTGFDMVGILAKVVNRPNPIITLGPVDFTCSFTVADIRRFDSPIVYASPTFLNLTGYNAGDVIGRNCRFLQAPDGVVPRGASRQYTDATAVAHLRRSLAAQKECQASLINYRKGGQPFINLVSIVPITWGDSDDIVYHVGFQVDLVEQPNAILQEMQNGKYVFNYSAMPPNRMDDRLLRKEAGVSLEMRDMVENLAARSLGTPQATDDQVLQELHNLLLDNSDDFIHVLSMKGTFLYVSASVSRILEYAPEDLLGKGISDIAHPSDIVSVLRELKDSSHPQSADDPQQQPPKPVNLLLRARRKHSGYVWLECTGRMHVEHGKGRKAIILTGRKREMPRLSWSTISLGGGLAERAFWAKTSVDGHFLSVGATSARDWFGWNAEDMIGSSLPCEWVHDPVQREHVKRALYAAAVPGSGPVRVSCHMGPPRKPNPAAVIICFYAYADPSGQSSQTPIVPWMEAPTPRAPSKRPTELVCQIMPLSTGNLVVRPSTASSSSDENVFAELETARSTSFQYEFQQMRNDNAKLKSELESRLQSRAEGR